MENNDILFKTERFVFGYRVAGVLIINGKILLQKQINDNSYAFPGGHVAFSETNEETLIREFREETGIDIIVKELKWVAEIFFPWDGKPCHQICLYYIVEPVEYNEGYHTAGQARTCGSAGYEPFVSSLARSGLSMRCIRRTYGSAAISLRSSIKFQKKTSWG